MASSSSPSSSVPLFRKATFTTSNKNAAASATTTTSHSSSIGSSSGGSVIAGKAPRTDEANASPSAATRPNSSTFAMPPLSLRHKPGNQTMGSFGQRSSLGLLGASTGSHSNPPSLRSHVQPSASQPPAGLVAGADDPFQELTRTIHELQSKAEQLETALQEERSFHADSKARIEKQQKETEGLTQGLTNRGTEIVRLESALELARKEHEVATTRNDLLESEKTRLLADLSQTRVDLSKEKKNFAAQLRRAAQCILEYQGRGEICGDGASEMEILENPAPLIVHDESPDKTSWQNEILNIIRDCSTCSLRLRESGYLHSSETTASEPGGAPRAESSGCGS